MTMMMVVVVDSLTSLNAQNGGFLQKYETMRVGELKDTMRGDISLTHDMHKKYISVSYTILSRELCNRLSII